MRIISIIMIVCFLIPLMISAQTTNWQAKIIGIGAVSTGGSFELKIEISETIGKLVYNETLFIDSGTYENKDAVVQQIKKLIQKYIDKNNLQKQFTVGEVIKL